MTHQSVSIVIPVKNSKSNLTRLLDSLDKLLYPSDLIEVIVCDNGSSDGSDALARERGCQVLELPKLSIAALRNRGADAASGSILAFVDSDCAVSSLWLHTALQHLAVPEVTAAGSYPLPPPDCTWVQEYWTLKHRLEPRVHVTLWLPSMNLIVRKSDFEAVGGFDESLRTCEDVDLCYRLRDRGGRIIWDRGISVTHFGEPATLRVLFKKERWHGLDNYRGLLRHGLRLEEIPSLALPIVVLGAFAAPIVLLPSSLLLGPILPILASPAWLLPPAVATAAALRTGWRARRPRVVPGLSAVYLVYLAARAAALLPAGRSA